MWFWKRGTEQSPKKHMMKYMIVWTSKPDQSDDAFSRYIENRAVPPEDVRLLGRWCDYSGDRGFTYVEAEDIEPVERWCKDWENLLTFDIHHVMDNDEMNEMAEGFVSLRDFFIR